VLGKVVGKLNNSYKLEIKLYCNFIIGLFLLSFLNYKYVTQVVLS
jgi:hypothetical protein